MASYVNWRGTAISSKSSLQNVATTVHKISKILVKYHNTDLGVKRKV